MEQRFPVGLGLRSVTGCLLAIAGGGGAIFGGTGSCLGRSGPVGKGAPAVRRHTPLGGPGSVAGRQFVILQRSRFVASHRDEVAVLRYGIAGLGHIGAPRSSLASLFRAVIADIARGVMRDAVSAVGQVAVAGFLIGVGSVLVAVGPCLVAVGVRLVGIRERLFAIDKGLSVGRFGSGRPVLAFPLGLPVGGILGRNTGYSVGHNGPPFG